MQLYNIQKPIKTLIFDIDSTLYTCPEYAHEQIDSQIRHFAKLKNISDDEGRKLVREFRSDWAKKHSGKKISLGNLLTHFGISIQESIEWRKTLFDPKKYLKEDKKLQHALSQLAKSFYLICVTNNPVEPAQKTLEALGVSNLIPQIIGLDTTFKSKPAKEIFDLALKKASEALGEQLSYRHCVSIGDRYDIDLALPLELGMGAILVEGVKDVYEIPEYLQVIFSKPRLKRL